MYPNITLHIDPDKKADIRLYKDEGDFRSLATTEVSLDDIINNVAEKIELDSQIEDLWQLANEGDELLMPFPAPNWEEGDLNHDFIVDRAQAMNSEREEYSDMTSEVSDQLLLNWQSDVLASAVASIYNLLIGRTLIFAEDMAIDRIVLDDLSGDPRLAERMASVMDDLQRELYLPQTDEINL